MNVFEYAIAQAEREQMTDKEAAEAIAAAKALEKPRKIPKAGVSICWVIDAREGAAGPGSARQGSARHGVAWQGRQWRRR